MLQVMRSNKFVLILLALLASGGIFVLGATVGYMQRPYVERVLNVTNKTPDETVTSTVDFEPFWKTWKLVQDKYVSREDIDDQALVWGAISGMVEALGDPYTVFLPPKERENFETQVTGKFQGIGAEIGLRNSQLVIISPLEGSPAQQAGLRAGDQILRIEDYDTVGITIDEAVSRIRGDKGTPITLTIFREGENSTREITIVRDNIVIPALATKDETDEIFRIQLFNFSLGSPQEFDKAIREFANSGKQKLILDLRNNPGGFLDAAVHIGSYFVPAGEPIAIEEFRDKDPVEHRSRGYAEPKNLEMIVLVNQGSASASEILAGALQEYEIATIIGEQTFGKGSVQELVDVVPGTSLKITIARWLTPNGRSISEMGLTPDEVIEIPVDLELDEDPVLDRAIELLTN